MRNAGAFALSAQARQDLSKALASKLPGTPERQRAFLDAAELEIDSYRKLLIPLHSKAPSVPGDLRRLADAAARFARTVKTADPRTLRVLVQSEDRSELNVREFEPVLRLAKDAAHAADLRYLLQQPRLILIHLASFLAER